MLSCNESTCSELEALESTSLRMEMLQRQVSIALEKVPQRRRTDCDEAKAEGKRVFEVPECLDEVAEQLVAFVQQHAEQGNLSAAIDAFDRFWELPSNRDFLDFSIGTDKADLIDGFISRHQPKVGAELGSLFGYSALHFTRASQSKSKLYCADPYYGSVRSRIFEHAGVSELVEQFGEAGIFLHHCASTGIKLDYLLIDHVEELYLPHLRLAISLGVLADGALIIVDNADQSDDLQKWLFGPEGSTFLDSKIAGGPDEWDQIIVATLRA